MELHPSLKNACWAPQVLVCKRNCTELKYYEDEYLKYFCPKSSQHPLGSLNMSLRVVGIRKVIEKFMSLFPDEKVQFVNLGAGLDTISFWVLENYPNSICYDSDLEFQVKLKIDIILRTKDLLDLFPNYKSTESTFSSERYNLFPCDLTNLDDLNKLKDFGFSDKLPTIYLNEFVLPFVPNDLSNKVIKFLSIFSTAPSIFIFHELVFPKSYFMKKIYLDILKKTNETHSILAYPTIESQVERYKDLGWENVFAHDLTFVYNNLLDKFERSRLRKIENFNDLRNLSLYSSHYLFGFAFNDFKEFVNFKLFLNKSSSNTSDNSDDELLTQYTAEELEKETDIDVLVSHTNNWLNVTLNTESEECESFYSKFV